MALVEHRKTKSVPDRACRDFCLLVSNDNRVDVEADACETTHRRWAIAVGGNMPLGTNLLATRNTFVRCISVCIAMIAPSQAFADGAVRICVEKAFINPVKLSGHHWDGLPGKLPAVPAGDAAAMVGQIATGVAPISALAVSGTKLVLGATEKPDPYVLVRVGDNIAIRTPVQHDTLEASWSPPSACAHVSKAELSRMIRIEVWDKSAYQNGLSESTSSLWMN